MCKIVNVYYTGKKSFWEKGIDCQIYSKNLYAAKKQFDKSCELCGIARKRMSCDCCPIRNAYELNVSIYGDTVDPRFYEEVLKDLIES